MDLIYLNTDNYNFNKPKLHNAGRYIVEYMAKNIYNISNSELEIINKKPKFKFSDINFSISHSKNIAAVCFASSPVGFDIEKIQVRDFTLISKRMNFKTVENTLDEFYRNWTEYEATYKLQLPSKVIYTSKLTDDYVFSIALPIETDIKKELNIIELQN